ncbi:hypothetical protein RFI_35868 [Reticulomyxa filosa]|uniref:Uncharacterized protein n=1 Tax=Reticulomyxa filosa TaxID=46433 RepID=X6LKA3_RETFI|nr:hypothetical protein RFI_35868 [Reticulomyxa filosa]|eukprot:ETO01572.1 hypothetical protein RFI_35868 [Reticulomyxa filosa]
MNANGKMKSQKMISLLFVFPLMLTLNLLNIVQKTKKRKLINCVIFDNSCVIIDERKKGIKMKELSFEELLFQTYHCLESKAFQKINNENLKLQLVDMRNNIIESNEDVMKEFESNEPTFKIIWTSFQQSIILGKTKTIKNALVILIAFYLVYSLFYVRKKI